MIKWFLVIILLFINHPIAARTSFGETLCHSSSDYICVTISKQDSWEELFPDPEQRDIVMRINRMNVRLRAGMVLAVPQKLDEITIYDVAPFPRYIESDGEKLILVSQKQLAWGAFDENGELVWWGPLSSGAGNCPNIEGHCLTPSGSFRIIRKQDFDCISTAFPRRADGEEDGGAEMPYCMHFFRGYALHGSDIVPGYRASHGCVRLFIEDARWLNEEFIDLPGLGGLKGTRVIIDSA